MQQRACPCTWFRQLTESSCLTALKTTFFSNDKMYYVLTTCSILFQKTRSRCCRKIIKKKTQVIKHYFSRILIIDSKVGGVNPLTISNYERTFKSGVCASTKFAFPGKCVTMEVCFHQQKSVLIHDAKVLRYVLPLCLRKLLNMLIPNLTERYCDVIVCFSLSAEWIARVTY